MCTNILLGNECNDTNLHFVHFLFKKLVHNFEWEGVFKIK